VPVGGGIPEAFGYLIPPNSGLATNTTTIFWPNYLVEWTGSMYTYEPGIASKPFKGGATTTLVSVSGNTTQYGPMVADDVSLYYVVSDLANMVTSLVKLPLTGGAGTTLLSNASSMPTLWGEFAVDETSLYWADQTANQITRLTPK
jgi:hypothetical protein